MGTPLITADKLRVKQVLINLLSNAIKFTPPGGKVTMGSPLEPEVRGDGPWAAIEKEINGG